MLGRLESKLESKRGVECSVAVGYAAGEKSVGMIAWRSFVFRLCSLFFQLELLLDKCVSVLKTGRNGSEWSIYGAYSAASSESDRLHSPDMCEKRVVRG